MGTSTISVIRLLVETGTRGHKMKTGVKYTVEVNGAAVSPAGQALIKEYLYDSNLPALRLSSSDWSWEWIVEYGRYRGKLPKRMAHLLKNAYNLKITSEQMSDIGNIAKGYILSFPTFILDFNESLDWAAGDFGDRGSCFWTYHAPARNELREQGVLAIRLYDEKNIGYARAWVYKIDQDTWILFNAYGVTTQIMANIFAKFLTDEMGESWEYDGTYLRVNNDDAGLIYLNAHPQIVFVKGTVPSDEIDLEWDLGEYILCYYCEAFVEKGSEHDYRGNLYCDGCYKDEALICTDCGVVIDSDDDEYEYDREVVCAACADDRSGTD